MSKRHGTKAGDFESLFLRLEELVLANSGEDEFEEVFKLLVAKLWDEQTGKPAAFRAHRDSKETFEAIRALLRGAENQWPGLLAGASEPALTPDHLQVCVDALSRHRIWDAGLEVMDSFFEFMVARGAKGSKGQYFTPRHVVEMCIRMLRPAKNETLVDPACGSGGFLIHGLNYVRDRYNLADAEIRQYCATRLWGFDIDARAVRVAKALMILAGDGQANIIRLNSLLRPHMGGLFPITGEDEGDECALVLTLEDICRTRFRHHKGFDVIATNPPFAGEVREGHILESYDSSRGKPRIERDVLFLERCIELLRPGGRLAMVLPHNKFATSAWAHVRQSLFKKARVTAVVGLGRNTFLPHTHQKASVLFARKRLPGEAVRPDERIFFAISEKDGKNSKGQLLMLPDVSEDESSWTRVDHDLGQIEREFSEFCEAENMEIGS
jgi:type I restriction enzyme M protein